MRYGLSIPISGSNMLMSPWQNYVVMLLLYFVGYYAVRDEKTP